MSGRPKGAEREPMTLRMLPETKDRLRRWTYENNEPASHAIDRLVAEYLDKLSKPQTSGAQGGEAAV